MPDKDRWEDRAMTHARLEESKRSLDALRVREREWVAKSGVAHTAEISDLEERYQALRDQAEGAWSASQDRVGALAADLNRRLDDYGARVKALWDKLAD